MSFRTRFAPSPTGPLHLGHAYSAILAHDMAMEHGGEFLLRIEDIDQSRARSAWEQQIYEDLDWLGLWWPEPVMRQSKRLETYRTALRTLWDRDLAYACHCSRKDIAAAATAPHEGEPPMGPDGVIYPGTCARLRRMPNNMNEMPADTTIRLSISNINKAFTHRIDTPGKTWQRFASHMETGAGPMGETGLIEFTGAEMEAEIGDIVLARRDMGTSYHLSVVLDDAAQGITHVVRGQDLFEATKIHVILQRLLGLPTPVYHHHKLIRDDHGKRLAKRDDARALSKYRQDGYTPQDIRKLVGL